MKVFLSVAWLFIPLVLPAQQEGKVIFRESFRMEVNTDGLDEDLRKMFGQMPEEQHFTRQLLFHDGEWLYADAPDTSGAEADAHPASGNIIFQMNIRRPESTLYGDSKRNRLLESKELYGRRFLISDTLPRFTWKMSAAQKRLGDYLVLKATTLVDTQAVVAWFTPQIPVSFGPAGYGGLPGLILELSFDNGQRHIVATEVTLEPLPEGAMSPPDKGRKVTRERFLKIQEEKRKEFEQRSRGRRFEMIIRHD